jgi:hypothetical protein
VSTIPGTVQFGRKFSFVVGTTAGGGLELGTFRCVFHIQRGDFQNPNTCDVRVYNLAPATANVLAQKEFTQLAVQAGYPGNYGLIFRGGITQVRLGRESQTDSYVDFTAGDGDEAYNFANVVSSQVAGADHNTRILGDMLTAMAAKGVAPGDCRETVWGNDNKPRGVVTYGSVCRRLRGITRDNDYIWSIQDGVLKLVPQTAYLPGAIPLISPDTGLIGIPEQTQNGVNMTVLLNPSIKIGQAIQLADPRGVNQYRFGVGLASSVSNLNAQQANKISSNGLYYVMAATHVGDSRGNDWYTALNCLSINATIAPGDQTYLQAFQVPNGPLFRY